MENVHIFVFPLVATLTCDKLIVPQDNSSKTKSNFRASQMF